MKKRLLLVLILPFFLGCSSIKLIDSWKSKDFQFLKAKKILIAAKSPNLEIRKSYETAIADQLKDHNIDAVMMHKIFPDFEEKERTAPKETDQIIKLFVDKGIGGVLVTSLKNTIETKKSDTPQRANIPEEYEGKSFLAFNNEDDINNTLPKLSAPENGGTLPTSKTYILEAVTYDLTLEKDRQLVSVSVIDITDPKSASKVLDNFSKIVSNQFKQ
ncbi:hypothetical protein J8L88_04655 [Aquimarina sp. MMG015]|uniref:hypothetical protein n=1 Tax=Aquimarina sp. MMG015 TaxID=2822689 RepID=UPI001B3A47B1|nr:hypothetical protein [Aquimarina sp. MMG015]MBQ4802136.1 hypothetical protein [Aquimarina sp. MMG015]